MNNKFTPKVVAPNTVIAQKISSKVLGLYSSILTFETEEDDLIFKVLDTNIEGLKESDIILKKAHSGVTRELFGETYFFGNIHEIVAKLEIEAKLFKTI